MTSFQIEIAAQIQAQPGARAAQILRTLNVPVCLYTIAQVAQVRHLACK